MKHDEYIHLRVAELLARRDYAAKLVMNRDMVHEVRMCDAQIIALTKELKGEPQPTIIENTLPKIDPLSQAGLKHVEYWVQGSNPQQLIHTDDYGVDTVLCENHLTVEAVACSNCIQPWPIDSA